MKVDSKFICIKENFGITVGKSYAIIPYDNNFYKIYNNDNYDNLLFILTKKNVEEYFISLRAYRKMKLTHLTYF